MQLVKRHEAVGKCNLSFSCLGCGHIIGQCKANQICGKMYAVSVTAVSCIAMEIANNLKENHSISETADNGDVLLTVNFYAGRLQSVPINLSNRSTSIGTMAIC